MTYQPYQILRNDSPSRWLVTCDHATNRVPEAVGGGSLGLSEADMARHIAFDPGAAGVTRALAARLDARAILTDFSRLVIDPNRGEDDPTLVMKLYDGTLIPGNRDVDAAEIERRKDLCYRPYHAALTELAARVEDTVMVSIHSFTPQLEGRPRRPWEVGVLHAGDRRLSAPLLDRMQAALDTPVGENEPYGGHLPGDAIDRHAIAMGRHNTLIEFRNDIVATEAQQRAWADWLAPLLEASLAEAEQEEKKHG